MITALTSAATRLGREAPHTCLGEDSAAHHLDEEREEGEVVELFFAWAIFEFEARTGATDRNDTGRDREGERTTSKATHVSISVPKQALLQTYTDSRMKPLSP